jgi:phage-related protein
VSKPIAWLKGEIRTPPFDKRARREAGYLLRKVQNGASIGLPASRPMPSIGRNCHELRIEDSDHSWRIVYCIEPSAIVILDVFSKSSQETPNRVIEVCRRRLTMFREEVGS